MKVHLPEHLPARDFDVVSEAHHNLLLERGFTRLLRRRQHVEMRSIRAVLTLITCAIEIITSFVPAWGADFCSDASWLCARALRCFFRCETTTEAIIVNRCVNAWDTM